MPDYSRADLIAAFRAENPDGAHLDDNTIFNAIATEDPHLALGAKDYQQTNAPDSRSWWDVAKDQAMKVGEGIVGAAKGTYETGRAALDLATGNPAQQIEAGKKIVGGVTGAVKSIAAPVTPIVQTIGNQVAPQSFPPATRQEWETGAQAAGANAAQLIGAKVGDLATPDNLSALATKARMIRDAAVNAPPKVPAAVGAAVGSTAGYAAGGYPGAVAGAGIGAATGGKVIPALAGGAAGALDLAARGSEAIRGGPQPGATYTPPADAFEMTVEQARAGQAAAPPEAPLNYQPPADAHALTVEQARAGQAAAPAELPPAAPPADAHALMVEQARAARAKQIEQIMSTSGTLVPKEGIPLSERAQAIPEETPPKSPPVDLQQVENNMLSKMNPDSLNPFTEADRRFQDTILEKGFADRRSRFNPTGAELPGETAAVETPALPPDVQVVQLKLLRRGKSASADNANLAIDNAQYLLEIMPEAARLSDIPGPSGVSPFDAALTNKLNAVGHEIGAKLESSKGKFVSTADAKTALAGLAEQAARVGDATSVTKIQKLIKLFGDSGTTTGEHVAEIRQHLNESALDISTGVGKDVYEVMKDLTEAVDPDLRDLNQQYYTLKTSAELGEVRTGGKSPQSQVGAGIRPKADLAERQAATAEAEKAQRVEAAKKARSQRYIKPENGRGTFRGGPL